MTARPWVFEDGRRRRRTPADELSFEELVARRRELQQEAETLRTGETPDRSRRPQKKENTT